MAGARFEIVAAVDVNTTANDIYRQFLFFLLELREFFLPYCIEEQGPKFRLQITMSLSMSAIPLYIPFILLSASFRFSGHFSFPFVSLNFMNEMLISS